MKASSKKRSWLIWLAMPIAVVAIVSAAYVVMRPKTSNKQATANTATSVAQPETKAGAPTGTVVKTGDSQYGTMLFDDKGQAIYIWQLEDSSTPECYGNCAQEWPPVLTDGVPVASGQVNSQLLGTTKRSDGTTQVTYKGHPLYYYAHEKPGEVECHNIKTHGGLWWVIQPNGVRAV